jgi:hypothetical protein
MAPTVRLAGLGDNGRSRANVRAGWQRGGSNDLHLTFLGDIDTMTEHS